MTKAELFESWLTDKKIPFVKNVSTGITEGYSQVSIKVLGNGIHELDRILVLFNQHNGSIGNKSENVSVFRNSKKVQADLHNAFRLCQNINH